MTIIEEIKDKVRIEDIVGKIPTVRLRKSGANYTGFCPFHANHDTPALVVWTGTQTWRCFGSCNEGGDVLDWVMKEHPGWDMKEAIKELAGQAGISLASGGDDLKARVTAQAKQSALKVAMGVMRRWLVGVLDKEGKVTRAGDAEALAYALDRGWTMDTIRAAGIGFSGRATAEEYKEMRGEFQMHGIDVNSPEAVMVLGFKGDTKKWAGEHGLDPNLFGKNYITGFMARPALVYAHKFDGKIEYISARFLPGFDQDRKSHNPSAALAGPRRPYFNWLHRQHHATGTEKGSRIYVVEGQGCAVTWGQFGEPAMALCGSSWDSLVKSGVVEGLKREYEHIFYVTDADTPGETVVTGKKNDFPLAAAFGGSLWVARTPKVEWERNGKGIKAIKDTNDVAQYLMDTGVPKDSWGGYVDEMTEKAEPIMVLAARYAGARGGQVREQAMAKVVRPMLLNAGNSLRVNYADALAEALYPSLGKTERTTAYNKWLNGELKRAKLEDDDEEELPTETTFGGWYPEDENENSGYLIEIYYDRKAKKIRFAYAHITDMKGNVREVGTANFLVVRGRKIEPPDYDELIETGVVKLASELGPLKSSRYLIEKMAEYYQRFFFLEEKTRYKFCASYSLFSWVYDCFEALNFLRARGGSGSGKSDFMYLVGLTSYRFAVTLATSSSASYRGLAKMYKASVMIDEADNLMKKDDGSMEAFLKGRAMKRYSNSLNMMETMTPNGKVYVPAVTPVYGITFITMYKSFADAGIENRCVTFDLSQVDTLTLDRHDMEPGYYPPELEEEALEIINMCLRWRLEVWMPKIELTPEMRRKNKLADPLVSPRVNQVLRPMKVLAVLQDDQELLNDLMMIGRANYEDEMIKRAGSFEAMALRALLAVDIAADIKTGNEPQASKTLIERVKGYGDLVKIAKVGRHGVVRHVLYKDMAKVINEMLDFENLASGVEDAKKSAVKSRTVGDICREGFRMPVERTGDGWAVILDRDKLDIAKLRFGLDHEADYQAAGEMQVGFDTQPAVTQEGLPQAGKWDEKTGRWL